MQTFPVIPKPKDVTAVFFRGNDTQRPTVRARGSGDRVVLDVDMQDDAVADLEYGLRVKATARVSTVGRQDVWLRLVYEGRDSDAHAGLVVAARDRAVNAWDSLSFEAEPFTGFMASWPVQAQLMSDRGNVTAGMG